MTSRGRGLLRSAQTASLPVALSFGVLWLAFNNGGFLALHTALAAGAAAVVSVAWIAGGQARSFRSMSATAAVGVGAWLAFAVWTLLSSQWSDAPGRALLEFDRTLLYALVFLVFATGVCTPAHLRHLIRALALVAAVVTLCAVLSRLLPGVFSSEATQATARLSWPIGYWNGLGLVAALGIVALAHLTTDAREAAAIRVVAAAIIPVASACLLLTLSRGAILATGVGLLLLFAMGRPLALAGGLLAAVPASAVAVLVAYGKKAIVDYVPGTRVPTDDGQGLAFVLLGCALAAGVVRLAALRLDRLTALRESWKVARRRSAYAAAGIGGILAVAVASSTETFQTRIEGLFTNQGAVVETGDRLFDPSSNGRGELWRVALEGFRDQPIIGSGAGTFQLQWSEHRDVVYTAVDGHSLWLETLGELGIVGLLLIVTALGVPLIALIRARRMDLRVASAAAACVATWMVGVSVDWNWELPAMGVWVVAALGLGVAGPVREVAATKTRVAPSTLRILGGLAALLLAVTPVRIWFSQRALDDGLAAFRAGDCGAAVEASLRSIDAAGSRPEPYELLGYCDVRLGQAQLAVEALRAALRRDPNNWELHYGLAVVLAADGQDPRPQLQLAAAANPLEPVIKEAQDRFSTDKPGVWRRRSATAPIPIPLRMTVTASRAG